jgi:Domain of unknown function (DUF5615)
MAAQLRRVLVLDENLNSRLAAEIRARGRDAHSVYSLGLQGLADPELLERLSGQYRPESWVLVTGDDRMPLDHGEELTRLEVTVATIDPLVRPPYNPDQWRRDVAQRWAHVMQEQPVGSLRRYSVNWHRVWTARRRLRRR